MARPLHQVLHHLRQATLRDDAPTDGQLLQLYLDDGDGTAFAALMRRHGPMVLGVCRRILGHEQDAEDAFQATFLVLARKAASVVPSDAVGNFLYGVAYRAALKAREAAARRRARERRAPGRLNLTEERPGPDAYRDDLDREIARLPNVYRSAVVLCELEGLSRKEAARRLGCPEGTLSSRLAKARRLLARRLTGPAALALALAVAGRAAHAAIPQALAATPGVAVRAEVTALTQGVLNAMFMSKIRAVVALAVVVCALAASAGMLTLSAREQPKAEVKPSEAKPDQLREAVAVTRLEGHTDGVMVVAFSPDSKRALSGGVCYGDRDPTVRLWDISTGKELLKLEGHTEGVYSLAFLPGGKKAVSGSADGTIRIWDLEGGKELKRLEGHEGTVYGLDVTRDGKLLLTGGEDGTVRLWDIEAGKEIRRFEGHDGKVRAVAFSADGKQAASGNIFGDSTLRIWDVETGKEVSKYTVAGAPVQNRKDPGVLKGGGLGGFAPNEFSPVIGGYGGIGLRVGRFPADTEGISSVAFSPDGKLVLAGCMDNTLRVFELATGKERRFEGHTKQLLGAVFTPDGKHILSGSYDQTVRLWDVATGKEVRRFFGHTNWVWGVAVSPDGRLGLSGSLDKTVRVWELTK
jgi:RNA polymerase sigma factor (sigma-70 family)